MSCGNPHLPDSDRPRRTPGGGKLVLIAALVAVPVICLCLGAVALVWWRISAERDLERQADLLSEASEPPDALDDYPDDAAVAYNSDSIGIDARELKRIQRLFDAIVVAIAANDRAAFLQLVDVDRFYRRASSGGEVPGPSTEPSAKEWVRQSIGIPGPWNRYRIVHVRLNSTGKGAVVHAIFGDADNDEYKVRWWIAQYPQGWKVYDWQRLEMGERASREMAVYYAYRDTAAFQEYVDCMKAILAADGFVEQGDFDEAARVLRGAEKIDPPPPLRDKTWLVLGNAWTRCGRMSEAMACFRRVVDPDALPGTLYGMAVCNAAWGRYEKALDFIAQCERQLGRGKPTTWDKADYLLSLRRDAEATTALRSLLDADPDQLDVLQSLGRVLPEAEQSVLIDYVNRCDDPVATGSALADAFFASGNSASLSAVVRLLDRHNPTPATRAQLEARIKQLDGDLPGACAMLQEAIAQEPDPDRQQAYANRYIELMLAAGHPVEAYVGSPDRTAAFAYLVDACLYGEYDFSDEDLTALIEARHSDQPDDPRLFYLEGVLLTRQKNYDDADLQFTAAMAMAADEDFLSTIRYERVYVLHLAGKDLEAYRDVGPAQETFRQLAGYFAWSPTLDAQHTATLKALVDAHRTAVPDDPWLFFYAGIVMENQGNYDAADQFFARGQQIDAPQDADEAETDVESIRDAYRQRRLQSRLRSGKILSALEEVPPASETFAFLAQRLSADRKWDQLASLIDTYRRIDPESHDLLRREADLLWQREDYAGVVRVLGPRWIPLSADLYNWEASLLRERLVRSYLRQDQVAEAQSVAKAMYDRGESLPLVLVTAAERDIDRTTHLVAELFPLQNLSSTVFYDEDVGPIVRGDDFLPLRRRCPPGVRYDFSGDSVVLLLRQPREPDAESLAAAAARALATPPDAGATIARLPGEPSPAGVEGFVARAADQTYFLAFGDDRYESGQQDELGALSAASNRALETHQGWLAIDASVFDQGRDAEQLAGVCRLAAELLGDDCLAVYFDSYGQLLPVEPATRDTLAAVQNLDDLAPVGDKIWLWRDATVDPAERQLVDDRRRHLPEFYAAFAARRPEQELLVQIRLRVGPLAEPQWIAVRQIDRGNYSGKLLRGEFVADSLLAPGFRAGEPVSVESYNVTDWKYPEP